MSETATQIPITAIIPMLTVIGDRNWQHFKQLEREFAGNYGVETWADVLNFRIMPALEPDAKTWLLVQRCSQGIKSIKSLE